MKQSSYESPEPAQPSPTPGRAHIDDIVEPEGEGTTNVNWDDYMEKESPAPEGQPLDLSAGFVPKWTVIAEEDIVQSHPHLAAETVLLVSVMADNSLFDLLSTLVADCFYSVAHQTIFTAMLTLQSRGIAISQSTLESQCAATGKSDSLPVLKRMSALLPELAVDRPTFYRNIETVRDQCVTRGLLWLLQTIKDQSHQGCSPADLIDRLQLARLIALGVSVEVVCYWPHSCRRPADSRNCSCATRESNQVSNHERQRGSILRKRTPIV